MFKAEQFVITILKGKMTWKKKIQGEGEDSQKSTGQEQILQFKAPETF